MATKKKEAINVIENNVDTTTNPYFPIRIRITDRVEKNGYKFNGTHIIKKAEDLPVLVSFKVMETNVILDNALTDNEIIF